MVLLCFNKKLKKLLIITSVEILLSEFKLICILVFLFQRMNFNFVLDYFNSCQIVSMQL